MLGGKPWTNGSVLDASRSALELGVRLGMPLGAAHRLVPEARFLDPDPAADGPALEEALDRLAGFSPGVAAEADPMAPGFGRVEVQLDGLERLWGAEPLFVSRIGEALADMLPGPPLAGIGGTRFVAAVAAAQAGKEGVASHGTETGSDGRVSFRIVDRGSDAGFLAPLPAAMLSRDPETRARLDRFGLRRIGQVAELPRSAVVARFGAEGERLAARARGEETDPFRPRRGPERLALGFSTDEPIVGLEAVRFVLRRVAGALAAQLDARGSAAGRARLTLTLDPTFRPGRLPLPGEGLPQRVVEQRLPDPSADPEALERLLLARLEKDPPAAPVARLDLELLDVVPAAGHQLALFVPQANAAARLGWQLARLAVHYGEGRVGRIVLADPEAPLPETRWTWRPVTADGVEPAR